MFKLITIIIFMLWTVDNFLHKITLNQKQSLICMNIITNIDKFEANLRIISDW